VNDATSRAETARLTKLSADAGFAAPASAALARASAAEASARTTQQRALCDIEIKTLVALSAMPEPVLRQKLTAAWVDPSTKVALPIASVPAQLLAQRPDVYQAAREVEAASADVGTARAARLPRLSINGSIAVGRARISGASTDVQTWSIGPVGLSLPIFDGGRGAANVDAAQARYDEAVALYMASVRQAVREVEVALVNLESARLRNEDARVAAEGYRLSFVATEARYRSGLASLVDRHDEAVGVCAGGPLLNPKRCLRRAMQATACKVAASRLVLRITLADVGLGPTQTSNRSVVGHGGYFANSTARVSRMTVTLIWPG